MKSTTIGALLLGLLLITGCSDSLPPELPPLTVTFVAPTRTATLYGADSTHFVGDASAADVGPIPDDSIWWSVDGVEFGRGREVTYIIDEGLQPFVLHARHGSREDSVAHELNVGQGLGRILWTVPLNTNDWDGISMSSDGTLYALDHHIELVAVSRDGHIQWRTGIKTRPMIAGMIQGMKRSK